MVKLFGKKDDEDFVQSPQETLGFSKQISSVIQDYLIKKYDFSSADQLEDIKNQLMSRKILIINAKKILENGTMKVLELKQLIDELKSFLAQVGGSLGRIGDQYLILTPNSQVRISN